MSFRPRELTQAAVSPAVDRFVCFSRHCAPVAPPSSTGGSRAAGIPALGPNHRRHGGPGAGDSLRRFLSVSAHAAAHEISVVCGQAGTRVA